jgi:(p)ppGpp synthase/HD superfamily hydrolase
MTDLEEKAREFAILWHGQQKRKYTGEPYWHHCRAVANVLRTVTDDEDLLAAAWLHDTLEDTKATVEILERDFGMAVSSLVESVTDVYTKTAYPHLNRQHRKQMECLRLFGISIEAKTLKLADITDNARTIREHDPAFAKVYLREKADLLVALKLGNRLLWERAVQLVGESLE